MVIKVGAGCPCHTRARPGQAGACPLFLYSGAVGVPGDRVGGGVAPPVPHHRTCGPASGGSSSRRIETLPCLAQCLQAEAVPVGVGQDTWRTLDSEIRQYPLLLPPHFRALLSEIPRIRRLCHLAAVDFH